MFFRPEVQPRKHDLHLEAAVAAACEEAVCVQSAVALARSVVDDCCGPLESFDVDSSGDAALTYGEIRVDTFAAVLRAAVDVRGAADGPVRRFCDVGSGRGGAVLAAALLLSDTLVSSAGVELEPLAAAAASRSADAFRNHPFRALTGARVILHSGDALVDRHLWRDSDLVYLCWTAFPEELRVAFARAFAEDLAPGSQLLLLSHALPVGVDQFALERTLDVACSWAPRVPAYLYRKRTARWRRPGDTPADAS